MNTQEWETKGFYITAFHKEVFVIEVGNHNTDTLVILHGYGTSSFDYYKTLDTLSKHYRVILLDLIGFGLSDKPKDEYFTIIQQTDIVLEAIRILQIKNLTLFGHGYGSHILNEIIVRKNLEQIELSIDEIIFCNLYMKINPAKITFSQLKKFKQIQEMPLEMLSSVGIYKKKIKELFFNSEKITDEELEQMWLLTQKKYGIHVIEYFSNYIEERNTFWYRWHRALRNSKIPIKMISSKNSPIALPEMIEVISNQIPGNEILWIENSGHFPMLENPEELVELILKN